MPIRLSEERQAEIVEVWERMRRNAMHAKKDYIKTAQLASKYYAGPHDFEFENVKGGEPDFKVTINKVYEMIRLFGPMTYAQNPARNVEPRAGGNPDDPSRNVISGVLKAYLNYTPGEFGLKSHSRRSIDESLLNGRGALFTGIDSRTGYVRSVSINTKDILIDPEGDTWYSGHYIMKLRRNEPLWLFARIFGKEAARRLFEKGPNTPVLNYSFDVGGSLDNDNLENMDEQYRAKYSMERASYQVPRVSWVEVYSKMGIGLREKKSDDFDFISTDDSQDNLMLIYEPTTKLLLSVSDWPIPFYHDIDKFSWPVSFVDPAENADKVWPISLIKPAMGEQKFLDWGWSFALSFIRATSKAVGVMANPVPPKVEEALKGNDGIIIVPTDVTPGQDVGKMLQYLNMPGLNPELLALLKEAEILFEKRTGMNEILYGTSQKVMRSATEAEMKAQFSRMRIDDIIDKVEDWQSMVARKEAMGARFVLDAQHMAPLVGEQAALVWDQVRGGDPMQIVSEYDYQVVSGSTRKRTPQAHIDTATMMFERMAQLRLMLNDVAGYNLLEQEFLQAHNVPNPERFMLGELPPPPQPEGNQEQQQGPPQMEVVRIEGGEPIVGPVSGEAS